MTNLKINDINTLCILIRSMFLIPVLYTLNVNFRLLLLVIQNWLIYKRLRVDTFEDGAGKVPKNVPRFETSPKPTQTHGWVWHVFHGSQDLVVDIRLPLTEYRN